MRIIDGRFSSSAILDGSITTSKIVDDAVTGPKLPDDAVGYFETATEVVVAFGDASPKDLLAADPNNDRLIMVQAIASVAAAGGPDYDVGSETTDPNAAFDDIGGGIWEKDDRFVGYCLLPATEKLQCTHAGGTAGTIRFRSVVLIPMVQTAQVANLGITTAKIANLNVTTGKVNDLAVTEAKIDSTLLIRSLPVARVESTNVDYCKVA